MATDANPNDTNDSVMAVKEHKFSTVSKFKVQRHEFCASSHDPRSRVVRLE